MEIKRVLSNATDRCCNRHGVVARRLYDPEGRETVLIPSLACRYCDIFFPLDSFKDLDLKRLVSVLSQVPRTIVTDTVVVHTPITHT